MNVKALRRTVDKIDKKVENPLCVFDMVPWAKALMKDGSEYDHWFDKEKPCGTVACFAGWAVSERVRQAYTKGEVASMAQEANKVLGVTDDQGDMLYDTANWPERFADRYYAAKDRAENFNFGTKRRLAAEKRVVKVLRERVEHFIATKGEE
jgi:hypothetical protein